MFKSTKHILELQRQNTLYKIAIEDLRLILKDRSPRLPIQYDNIEDPHLKRLFMEVANLLADIHVFPDKKEASKN